MSDDLKIGCFVAFLVVGGAGLLFLVAVGSALLTCNNRYSAFQHRYGVLSGCLLNIDNKWIPSDAYYIKEDIQK